MKNSKLNFIVFYDKESKKSSVEHRENGTLIDEVDNLEAAKAIAILANLGCLYRSDAGDICVASDSGLPSVETHEEYMEQISDITNDDSPSDEESALEVYEPLSSTQE